MSLRRSRVRAGWVKLTSVGRYSFTHPPPLSHSLFSDLSHLAFSCNPAAGEVWVSEDLTTIGLNTTRAYAKGERVEQACGSRSVFGEVLNRGTFHDDSPMDPVTMSLSLNTTLITPEVGVLLFAFESDKRDGLLVGGLTNHPSFPATTNKGERRERGGAFVVTFRIVWP